MGCLSRRPRMEQAKKLYAIQLRRDREQHFESHPKSNHLLADLISG
jgi:hypothetical protein